MLHAQFITEAWQKVCVFHILHKPNVCFPLQLVVHRGRDGECHVSSVCNVWWYIWETNFRHFVTKQNVCWKLQVSKRKNKKANAHGVCRMEKGEHLCACLLSYLVQSASPWDLLWWSEPPRSWRDAPGSHPHCLQKTNVVHIVKETSEQCRRHAFIFLSSLKQVLFFCLWSIDCVSNGHSSRDITHWFVDHCFEALSLHLAGS